MERFSISTADLTLDPTPKKEKKIIKEDSSFPDTFEDIILISPIISEV